MRKISVCVLGAGPAGLCAARHLSNDSKNFEFEVFERGSDIGGLWIYDERTGHDENGYPIHSAMYEDLRTNFPLKLMNFPDYQTMGQTNDTLYGNHQDVIKYLRDYTEHFQLRQYIQFNTIVERVTAVPNNDYWETIRWNVRIKNLKTKLTEEREYDGIMICNGHYVKPDIPVIPGIETFHGHVIHSHDYRYPDNYVRRCVIVLGAGNSGIDIATDLVGYANKIYVSHNGDRLPEPLPCNMVQVAGIERIDGRKFILRDGNIVESDYLIYCTGYKYDFPFLDDSCMIKVENNYVSPLYMHLVNIEAPTMSIVGIPRYVLPFAMFHLQVQFHLKLILGLLILPSKSKMLEDWERESIDNKYSHALGNKQFHYCDELARLGALEKLSDFYREGTSAWQAARAKDFYHYKNIDLWKNMNFDNTSIILPRVS